MNKLCKWNEDLKKAMLNVMDEDVDTARRLAEFFEGKDDVYVHKNNDKYMINTFFPEFPGDTWSRFVHGLSKVSEGERIPFQADVVVTSKCHCDCWHCFRANYVDKSELSYEKLKEIYESLKIMGTSIVGITGGEPMLRKDIIDIISMVPKEFEAQLFTTGVNIDNLTAEKLAKAGLKRCIISLDHYREEEVCRLRNNKNAYRDAVTAIKEMVKQKIYVAVTICITEELMVAGELEKYMEFTKELGVDEIRVVATIPEGKLEGKEVVQLHYNSQKIIRNLKNQYRLRLDYPIISNFGEIESFEYLGCGAGAHYISVNSDGKVTPCVSVPLSFGNIHECSLESIYDDMGKYFPISSCSCIGVACDAIKKKKNIDISHPPADKNVSIEIINEYTSSARVAKLFRAIRRN